MNYFILSTMVLKIYSMKNEWKKFNEPNFKYADCSTCSKKLGLDTYKNTNGFFTEYSMTIPSEDMAEVYSHLIYWRIMKF